jgi:DNA polymerase-3 subunit beta
MEAGQGVEEVEVDFDGSIEIGFNARYVLDIAQRAKGEEIVIEMGDPASPARVLDRGNPGVQWVLMPLRT